MSGVEVLLLRFFCLYFDRQPALAAAHQVVAFATQLVNIEAENAKLRKESAQSVVAANRLAQEAWQANEDLKKEIAQLKTELALSKEAAAEKKKKEAAEGKALKDLLKNAERLLGMFGSTVLVAFGRFVDCMGLLLKLGVRRSC